MSLLVALLWLAVTSAVAAPPPLVIHRSLSEAEEAPLSPEQRKIHPLLRHQLREMAILGVTPQTAQTFNLARRFESPLLKVNDAGRIQVYVHVTQVDDGVLGLVRQHGLDIEIVNAELGILQGWLPFDRIEPLAREGAVRRIRPPDYGTRRTGSVTSEGDAILRANLVRSLLGVDGSGVRVGVISDGVEHLAQAQATGDLPVSVTVGAGGQGDEGTAMLEIIHDLAPGAILGFHGISSSLDFLNALNFLANVFRAQVIVDDIGFFTEPYFEDGPVAQAVKRLVDQGVIYVSAAGNDATNHYQGFFTPGGPVIASHDFGGGDLALAFAVRSGISAIVFEWGDPFGNATDDYDLCIYADANGSQLLGCSAGRQTGLGWDPIEGVVLSCAAPGGCTGSLQIKRISGSPRPLELFVLRGELLEHRVEADSVFGHPAVTGALAIGAIRAADPGNDDIEFFSSRGNATILFPTPEMRPKPDLAAIDGVSVTGAGGFPSPFFGTSAAAPHAAAVAALLLQVNPTLPPLFLREVLGAAAVDLGPPGFDPTFGFGRIDALAAVAFELGKPSVEIGTNQPAYRGGDRMVVGVRTHPGQGSPLWDLYVVLVLPDQTLLFYRFAPNLTFSPTLQPARPLQAVSEEGFVILDGILPGDLPVGIYFWAAALITPDLKHVSRIVFAPFSYQP